MFDVGFSELVLLALVALIVLGPERLPKVARTVGGLTRKARSSWLNLKRSIEAEMRADELKAPLKKIQDEVKSVVKDVKSSVDDVNTKVKKETEVLKQAVESPQPAQPQPNALDHEKP